MPSEQGSIEKYLARCNIVMDDALLTNEELRNAFLYSKTSKNRN